MAFKASVLLAFLSIVVLILVVGTEAGGIAIYWGQNGNEGTLAEACASGNYDFVNMAFLPTFGNGQTPMINLAGHCDPYSNDCTGLSLDVKSCQARHQGDALYWGRSWELLPLPPRKMLGKSRLTSGTTSWGEEQANIGMILLSTFLDTASEATSTLLGMLATLKMHGPTKIFLGLPAAPDAAGSGFIPVGDLISTVLPAINDSAKYGGVILWSKYYDEQTGYSSAIKSHV
ncbi:hypothetical protein AAG906_027389 [Vitis piasezkii]